MISPEATRTRPVARMVSLLWVIVIAIIFAFCFFASSVCITLLLAAFLAILAEPLVARLENWNLPRPASAALVVLAGLFLLGGLIYVSYDKADRFAEDFPIYAGKISNALEPITEKVQRLQQSANNLNPVPPKQRPREVHINDQPSWPSYLIRGLSSVWGAIIVAAVLPFLVFFLLLRKDHIYTWLSNAFGLRMDVPAFAARVNGMVRTFVIGNFLVGAISALVMVGVLLALRMDGAVALGIAAGILNTIPYLGGFLAAVIPLLAGTLQYSSAGPFVIIGVAALMLHLFSANLLIPKLVGSRVNVDPVAATVGILFWGWLWGAMGVVLAVPLTAFVRLVAETRPSLVYLANLLAEKPKPVPRWALPGAATVYKAIPFLRDRFRHGSHP
jgi:predicted PurR-regulated permease PerM